MFGRIQRDHWAGLLIVVLGIGILLQALQYDVGTMAHVGPGFVPIVLGILLTMVGVGIALAAGPLDDADDNHVHTGPDLRGWFCIVASVLLFAGLAQYTGMIPAIFACVLVAALGDREARLASSLVLAIGITVFGVVVFSYGLGVQIPLLRGWPQ